MTDPDFEVAEQAPTDDEGHPIHPEKGHRICAATKSDRTTPTEHGRERDDYEYCLLAAGWGVDDTSEGRCSHHFGAVDNRGENHPNFKHGAYAEFATSSLTEGETAAFEDVAEMLEDPNDAQEIARHTAAWCSVMAHRTGDERWVRRFEGVCEKFNIAPDDVHQIEHTGQVDHQHEHELTQTQRDHLDMLTGGGEVEVEAVEEIDE